MATKRGRSLSLTDNEPPAKRGKDECTNVSPQLQANDSNEIPALVTCTTSSDSTVSNATMHNLPLAEANAESEAPMVRINEVQTDILSAGVQDQEQSDKMVVPVPLKGKIVVAPEFAMVHDSWEAFDVALKAHGKRTYQLYVIRSTTSVKRRNIKIGESMGRGDVCSNGGPLRRVGIQQDVSVDHELNPSAEKTLIPEQYQWYSKSLKCTHGWKNRYRGTGKRGSGVVRSTSCPAKMCVTLQHRGSGPDDWKVVVTKHVRTHNHQLSRELYLYYTENRRIYDPDLLAVAGETLATKLSIDFENATFPSLIDQAFPRPDFSRMLISSEDQGQQQQASSMVYMMSDSSSATGLTDCHTDKQVMPLSDSTACVGQSQTTLTSVPSLNTMILTPGTLPPSAMDGGGFCVPRVAVKIHACWTAFHDYVAQYAFDTSQVFRTRSTVSVAARNAKLLASISTKTGSDHASHAKDATTGPTSRLIPTECKWFSKLLICTHGWKRRVRNESSQVSKPDNGPCPAMLLARMERNVNGNWQVVINRQVVEHNHKLGRQVDETSATHHEPFSEIAGMLPPAQLFPSTSMPQTSNGDHPIVTETQTISPESHVDESQSASSHQCDIVVRVPRIQSMFSSWDDFHASLKLYSDATYQLYRTRTTSSVKGRNKKIAQMEDKSEDKDADNDTEHNFHTALNGGNAARRIPDSWRWYSKTLTCTHGWKERHRGTGKRNAHGVRSTECPVKICATVQYLPPSSRLETDTGLCEREDESCWRVVVTKHVVDHNHNLSRELYQHYCENRRIYDPELLTVDTSNSSTVVTRKTGSSGFNEQGGSTAEATKSFDIQFIGKQLPPQSVLSMQMAEAVSQAQLFDVSSNQPSTFVMSSAPASLVSVSTAQQTIPSVVLLPSSSTSSTLSDRAQALQEEMLQQQKQQLNAQQQPTLSALVNATIGNVDQASEGSQSLATQASGPMTSATLVPFNNAGMTMSGALPPTGLNVISRACRVHGSSLGTKGGTMGTTDAQAPPCTCFRMARGSDYVTIVPASEPLGRTEPNGSVDQDSIGFTETVGVWQPSSKFEITKATTESGDTIWRVPRIRRRYPTWAIFHKYLDEYSTTTFQLYRVRTTYSVRSRNIRLRQLAASRGLTVREGGEEDAIETEPRGDHGISRAHLVPEEYEWYSKTFLCTHGWKRRSRGSGQRMSHNVRATECPAKVCATLQRTDDSNNWSVVVTKHLAEHNHELSEALYQLYSEVRRVRDPAVLAQAEQVWRAGATRRRVFEFLKEQSPNQTILMKDVHNLVQRWQTQERRPRQEVGLDDQEGQPPQPKSVGSSSHDHASVSWL